MTFVEYVPVYPKYGFRLMMENKGATVRQLIGLLEGVKGCGRKKTIARNRLWTAPLPLTKRTNIEVTGNPITKSDLDVLILKADAWKRMEKLNLEKELERLGV